MLIYATRQHKNRSFTKYIYLSEPYRVALSDEGAVTEDSPLSLAEREIIENVFTEYGALSRWDICKTTHEFPEWEDPQGSSLPIQIKDILERNNKTEPEANAILAELDALAYAEDVFA